MKIIDKVLEKNPSFAKFEIIGGSCPSRWGYKNTESKCEKSIDTCADCWNREIEESVKETPRVLYPTTRNLDEGLKNNNLSSMAKKLCEETVEVMEAATIYEMGGTSDTRDKLVQELMDTVQMSLNILNYINGDIGLDMQEQIKLHNDKLQERGWEWDTGLSLEVKEALK